MESEPTGVRAAILHTLIITAILIAADFFIRHDELVWAGARYLLVIPELFFLLFFVRKLIVLISGTRFAPSVALLVSLLMGIIWGAQYIFYGVYQEFLSARDMGVVISNLSYWIEHGAKLLSIPQLYPIPLYTLLFYAYFSLSTQATSRLSAWKWSGLTVAGLLGFSLSFNLVQHAEAKEFLTPFLYTVDQTRKLLDHKAEYLIHLQKDSAPARRVDSIPPFQRRGDFNVLFVLQESLRSDHTSLFGYARDTTPDQKQRFRNAWLYPYAISNSGITRNSCHSIFTGLKPEGRSDLFASSLIWQYAKAAGLDTFYISSHWLEWEAMDHLLLDSRYVDSVNAPLHADPTLGRDDMATVAVLKKWLQGHDQSRPFFGVLHFSGTHYPYLSGDKQPVWKPSAASFNPDHIQETVNQYDNAIQYLDGAVESALSALDKAGLSDNTIIISSSDHGEAFYEHKQFFHGKVFWQEGYRVPLFVSIPEKLKPLFAEPEKQALMDNRSRAVSNLDIFPTILDFLNIPAGKPLDGHSLLQPYPPGYTTARVEAGGYIAIQNQSRVKHVVNNKESWLARVDLTQDPLEKNPEFTRIEGKMSLDELLSSIPR